MQNANQHKQIVVGTRIYTGLYNHGMGTVYAIHGEQSPDTVRRLGGGFMTSGGSAEFDIVFDDGGKSSRLPECILLGVQWQVFDEVATPDEIAKHLANATCYEASKKAEEQLKKEAFAREVERLKIAPEYAHLKQIDNETNGRKLAVMNIRTELKRQFKGVKFSVRSDYNSVRINWTDGPTENQIDELAQKYKDGHFNGMEDIYEYSRTPFTDLFGSMSYISARRDTSPELVQKAIDSLFAEYPGNFSDVEKPTAQEFKNGSTYQIYIDGFCETLQMLIHRKLAKMSA